MDLHINDDKTLDDVAAEFADAFPFLRLSFYSEPHENRGGSLDKYALGGHLKIGAVRTSVNNGDLHIHGNMHVSTLENAFRVTYGLYVQVFRKSGDVWLQTTATDEWSLSKQNAVAMEMDRKVEG
ncbi:MAG: hypothetical protein H6585_09245 [Flavobacteriales bacterium]|nr:hypothetical protein [Flavobacteriales bacterium]MCB9448514.1 hypothetical protein [Flavobacteriales bacterium]